MDPVIHFEIPAIEMNRMIKFYSDVFGWRMQKLGKEMGNYVVVTTTEVDQKTMRPKISGAINGGFYQRTEKPNDSNIQYPSIVIAVDDVDEKVKKIIKAGGKLSGEINDIPGIGRYASFIDCEGNRLSIMKPIMK